MTAARRRERLPREERRELLLDALLHLVATEGFAAVSMEGIARAGEIAKTVVYDVFGDLDSALRQLVEREQQRALAAVAAAIPGTVPPGTDPSSLFTGALAQVLQDVRARPDSWRLILLPADGTPPALRSAIEEHRLRLVDQITPLTGWMLGHYGLPDLDLELIAHVAVGATEHAARLALLYPDRFTPERFESFIDSVVALVAAPARSLS